VTQTVIQRAISSGLYFPLEQIFTELFNAHEEQNEKRKSTKLFISGMSAGAINGVIMNPLTRIKVNPKCDWLRESDFFFVFSSTFGGKLELIKDLNSGELLKKSIHKVVSVISSLVRLPLSNEILSSEGLSLCSVTRSSRLSIPVAMARNGRDS
jgi:hypothetical protein